MKIFDKNNNIIENPDLEKGHLTSEHKSIIFRYEVEQEAKKHYEVIKEYPNGGKDVAEVIDSPEVGKWVAYDENNNIVESDKVIPEDAPHENEIVDYEEFQRYIEYTADELIDKSRQKVQSYIDELKERLKETDYTSIKFIDNLATCTNIVSFIKLLVSFNKENRGRLDERIIWREKINRLESKLADENATYEELNQLTIDNIMTNEEMEELKVPIEEEVEEAPIGGETVEEEVISEETVVEDIVEE